MYIGEWKINDINGFYIYNYINGSQNSGKWRNNQMLGYGDFIWVEEKKYIGFCK